MSADVFCATLLEEAKRFLEKSKEAADPSDARSAYLRAALYLGTCSLEGYVNSIASDFLTRNELTPHERAFLAEKEVRFADGGFIVSESLKMTRLEDRIAFLCAKYGRSGSPKTQSWWNDFKVGMDLRNNLTHPKGVVVVEYAAIERFLASVIQLLDFLFRDVYKKAFPAKGRGLDSKLSF